MSFSTFNSPPLVTIAGVGIHFVLEPYLKKILPAVQDPGSTAVPLNWYKFANILSFAVQVVAVTRPGRIDGDAPASTNQNNNDTKKTKLTVMDQLSPGKFGRTLVAPSGWAFAIWGPIFLGEFACCTSQLVFLDDDSNSVVPALIKQMTVPFVSAQLFQTLWTAAFRPKYAEGNHNFLWKNKMYTSAFLLASTAYSLSKAHSAFATMTAATTYTFQEYITYFLPISLHFGWTCAATLVNLNGAIALVQQHTGTSSENSRNEKGGADSSESHGWDDGGDAHHARIVQWVGHVSVAMASIAGMCIAWTRGAPVYAGVIAWALSACADGMNTRIKETSTGIVKKDDDYDTDGNGKKSSIGVHGAPTQRWLCRFGAYACSLTSLVTTIYLKTNK
mmetsp:Transcript_25453/g.39153  ORF Transcript_25453/g.39153 Transcript_25453/m.39153 type:complete len:390 (-) Transcript_25453:812-1981(-)|eukprot:CAMPEP_0195304874 /NCGR_PEP_ID=MMETSP0707-20130614/35280_1 /TAXON_ID=33640 /ORGANISM="Asterionellopsis glacialis, Strain CCMP134" /LENGTH=389 /DNA_ID=CAMNT_0040368827 /DNA_START=30 /DNA_END=1199 /DNA_ORIENTATION=+